MRAIDTNVVVRLLLRDDPGQAERVDKLVARGGLIVPFTVLMETEWVLRAVYKLERAAIAELLQSLPLIEGLEVADAAGVSWAAERYANGADFADMIHLLTSEAGDFLTFDRSLTRSAGNQAPCRPVLID